MVSSNTEGRGRQQFEIQRHVQWKKEDKDNNSRYKDKFNWSKKMKTLIRDAEINSNEKKRWTHQLEIQGLVQMKIEDDDIVSRYKGNFKRKRSWRHAKLSST